MLKSSAEPPPRILIADDQPDVLEALRLLLKGEGYQLESATSPAGVISALEARDFDVVLIDLRLDDGMDGLDVVRELRRQTVNQAWREPVESRIKYLSEIVAGKKVLDVGVVGHAVGGFHDLLVAL